MENKLGEITYGDYCVEFYVHFKGRQIHVRATSDTTFEFPVDEFADGEDELLNEFIDWLEENISVRLTVSEKRHEEEVKELKARIKRLEEECNWLEQHTRKVQ